MRVAQLIETLDAGGAEKLAVDIANELATRGHESHLLVLKSGGPFQSLVADDVVFHDVGRPRQDGNPVERLFYSRETVSRLAGILRRAGVEALQTHLPKANFLGLALARSGVCRVYPTVHNNREFDYGDGSGRLRLFLRKRAYRQMLGSCQAMIAVSEQVREAMLAELGVGSTRGSAIKVVTNGVVVPALCTSELRARSRSARGIAPGVFLIVAMGRLSRQKSFASLISALAAWTDGDCDWQCIIAGEGDLRPELEEQVRRSGLTGRIALPGHENDVHGLFAAADVFCLPSLFEGLPLALMEAMAAGLPVCAYSIGGVTELVVDGVEGLLSPPQDFVQLGGDLRQLAADPERRRIMGDNARAAIGDRFGFERVVDMLEEIYQA